MNEHEKYMQDFLTIYETLESWGPGSEQDTTKAFKLLEYPPESILEIGCGKGNATITLAGLSDAQIIATDNEQQALDRLEQKIAAQNLSHRVATQCISMTELNFENGRFDLIWAEASIYIMGVEHALKKWNSLIKHDGMLVFSDLVWLTESRSNACSEFWKSEYPDMQTVQHRLFQIQSAGFRVIDSFSISKQAWKNYYEPLQERLHQLRSEMPHSQAFADIQKEVNLYSEFSDEYGYQFFILQKL